MVGGECKELIYALTRLPDLRNRLLEAVRLPIRRYSGAAPPRPARVWRVFLTPLAAALELGKRRFQTCSEFVPTGSSFGTPPPQGGDAPVKLVVGQERKKIHKSSPPPRPPHAVRESNFD